MLGDYFLRALYSKGNTPLLIRRLCAAETALADLHCCVAFFTLNCFMSFGEETGGQGLECGNDLEIPSVRCEPRSLCSDFDVEASISSVLSVHVSLSGPLALLT